MTNKFTMIGIFARMMVIGGKIFDAWRVILAYGAALTLLVVLMGMWTYTCGVDSMGFWCLIPSSPQVYLTLFAVYVLLALHLIFAFAVDFYDVAFNDGEFKWKNVILLNKDRARRELFVVGWVLALIVPLAVASRIIAKPANPDWQIEFVWFMAVFALLMATLWLLRVSAFVSVKLAGQTAPTPAQIYDLSSGHGYAPIILLLLLFGFAMLFYMSVLRHLGMFVQHYNYLVTGVAAQFVDSVVKMGIVALIVVFFRAMHELLMPPAAE